MGGAVTLRITTSQSRGATVVKAAGKLAGDEVKELERACAGDAAPSALDVSHLDSADEAGLRLLRALAARGVSLRGLSPFIALLLKGGP
jgi:hypothetical protein